MNRASTRVTLSLSYLVKTFSPILFLMLFAACDDDDPKPDNPGTSVAIGDHIYTLIQGDGQSGAKGSLLEEEIQLIITDFTGGPVARALSFELSDPTSSIGNSYYYTQDTVKLRWRLGCETTEQTLRIVDPNVCGLAENGCIEVEIFEITAIADDDNPTGWISPCLTFSINDGYDGVLSGNDQLTIAQNSTVYTTDDPLGFDWKVATSRYDLRYLTKKLTSSGRFYYFYADQILILDETREAFLQSWPPTGYIGSEDVVEMTSNDEFFFASSYSNLIYRSTDGINWTPFIDILEETEDGAFRPQAMVSDDNLLYIVTNNNYVIRVNTTNGIVDTYHFPNEWPSSRYLGNYEAQSVGADLFLKERYDDEMVVLNINTQEVQHVDLLSSSYSLHKTGESLFITNSFYNIQEWTNESFVNRSFSYPEIYNYDQIGMYNGYPLLLDYEGRIYLFND